MYQDKLRYIAADPNIKLTVLLPERYLEGSKVVSASLGDGSYDVITLPTVCGEQGLQNRFWYKGLSNTLKAVNPDIIHAEEEPESLVTAQLIFNCRKLKKRPKFVGFTWRNMTFPLEAKSSWNWKSLLLSTVQRYSLNKHDMIIGGSHLSEKYIRASGFRGPMRLIPQYGVNPEVYFPISRNITSANGSVDSEKFTIGFVGRILEMKGLHVLVNAMTRLPSDCELVILGSGEFLSNIQNLVSELKLTSRVKFKSGIPARDVPEVMRMFDVLCIPSLTSSLWREQFGRVIIEAMACGTPVVGSSSGEIPYVIGDAGLVCMENDVDALADALNKLYVDSDLRNSMRLKGIQRVEANYTNQIIAQQILEVYQTLTEKL